MLLDRREELLRPRRSRDGWAGPPGARESASGSQGHIVDPKLRFSGSGGRVKENSPVLRPEENERWRHEGEEDEARAAPFIRAKTTL